MLSRKFHHRLFFSCALFLSGVSASSVGAEPVHEADIVVYGGTSAGVIAAIEADRLGKSVILIARNRHLGGLTTNGLGATDSGHKSTIGGLAREFYRRVKRHYDEPTAWRYERRDTFSWYRKDDDAIWVFEPHVAERVYEEMLKASGVRTFRNTPLDRTAAPVMKDGRLVSIRCKNGLRFSGKMFIDATYEGDLMAVAGVTYTVGREPNDKYGETLNGVQTKANTHNHRFIVPVDAYRIPGDRSSGLVPRVHAGGPGKEGAGDDRIQAYCFRMCMSDVPENRVPFPKPAGYDESQYELLFRNFEAGDLRLPLSIRRMPNGKTDTNNNGAFSTDNIGMNDDYAEASDERRAEIVREHEIYQKGLMWTLANHSRVPDSIRKEMAVWGLARDEFTDNGNWPHEIYVREARRMVSDYVTTELDCRRIRVANDSVGLGSYNMDSHNVQRYVTEDGKVQNEGDVQVSPRGPYVVSYRSIVPRASECRNLFVPVCLSASHIAYGSIRMEPVFMILGHSSAAAAALAIDLDVPVQDVPYRTLRKRLQAEGQVLDIDPRLVREPGIDAKTLAGTVVDDRAAEFVGAWQGGSLTPHVGQGYRHDGNRQKGEKKAIFKAELESGRYEVRLAYTAHGNRATRVPVTIEFAGGKKTVYVNQRKKGPIRGVLLPLGTFEFSGDRPATVVIGTSGTDGYVIADAVQFLRR